MGIIELFLWLLNGFAAAFLSFHVDIIHRYLGTAAGVFISHRVAGHFFDPRWWGRAQLQGLFHLSWEQGDQPLLAAVNRYLGGKASRGETVSLSRSQLFYTKNAQS
jgi:hypothetical protein